MSTTKQKTRLLTLPAELRNVIYAPVLVSNEPIDLSAIHKAHLEPGLLAVCLRIRSEALPIYYGRNIFSASILDSAKFIGALDEERREMLRCVDVDPPPDEWHWSTDDAIFGVWLKDECQDLYERVGKGQVCRDAIGGEILTMDEAEWKWKSMDEIDGTTGHAIRANKP